MKEYTVDRIEGANIICLDCEEKTKKIPVAAIPFTVNEGDILLFGADGVPVGKNDEKTAAVKEENKKRLDELFGRNK